MSLVRLQVSCFQQVLQHRHRYTLSAMFSAVKEKMQVCAQFGYKRLVINSILRFRLFFQTRRRRLLQTVRGRTKEERGWEGGAKEEGRGREEDSAGWIRWSIWKTLIIYIYIYMKQVVNKVLFSSKVLFSCKLVLNNDT